ncbi:hypothetical protein D3C77_609560 [compost metagenome]
MQVPPVENVFPFEIYPDPAFIEILSSENDIGAVNIGAGMAEADESVGTVLPADAISLLAGQITVEPV